MSDPTSPAVTPETVPELIQRLQNNVCAEPVRILVSCDKIVRPAFVEETSLVVISKFFARDFSKEWPYARFWEAKDADRKYNFFDFPPECTHLFLYWLTHRTVPARSDFTAPSDYSHRESIDLVTCTDSDWQWFIAKTYRFAEDNRIKEMMNAVIPVVIQSLRDTKLTQKMLQKILRLAGFTGKLRAAIIDEALNSEKEDRIIMLRDKPQGGPLDMTYMAGMDLDVKNARAAFNARGKKRGEVSEFFVELDAVPVPKVTAAPPRPAQPGQKRERSPSPEQLATDQADSLSPAHVASDPIPPSKSVANDRLTVEFPVVCDCTIAKGPVSKRKRTEGDEIVAKKCQECNRYKKPPRGAGMKFAWRAETKAWMWVLETAPDGKGPADEIEGGNRVWVGGLAAGVDWHQLKVLMCEAGEVNFVRVSPGSGAAWGIVEYAMRREAKKGIESLNGEYFLGSKVQVREKRMGQ